MKKITLSLSLFILSLISCKNLGEVNNNMIKISSEEKLEDRFKETKYSNFHIEKNSKIEEKYIEDFHKEWTDFTFFIESQFTSFLSYDTQKNPLSKVNIFFIGTYSAEPISEKENTIFVRENILYNPNNINSIFDKLLKRNPELDLFPKPCPLYHKLNEDLSEVVYDLFSIYKSIEKKEEVAKDDQIIDKNPLEKLHISLDHPILVSDLKDLYLQRLTKTKIGDFNTFKTEIFSLLVNLDLARLAIYEEQDINHLKDILSKIEALSKRIKASSATPLNELKEAIKVLENENIKIEHETFSQKYQKGFHWYLETFFPIQIEDKIIFIEYSVSKMNKSILHNYIKTLNTDKEIIVITSKGKDTKLFNSGKVQIIEFDNELINAKSEASFNESVGDLPTRNLIRDMYSKIPEFLIENLNSMNLDNLTICLNRFFDLIKQTDSYKTSIASVDNLIDYPLGSDLLTLLKAPKSPEITFFLKNINRDKIVNTPKEQYVINFVHFHHLLVGTRIAKEYRHIDADKYFQLKKALELFLENPLREISENEFQYYAEFFFNPFNSIITKVFNFWKPKYQLSAYLLDPYEIEKNKGSCIYKNCYHEKLKTVTSKGVKRFMYLSGIFCESVKIMTDFTLLHELGHHLQFSEDFFHSFIENKDKVNNMGSELEADMYAGFCGAHKKGFNLSRESIIEASEFLDKKYGDKNPDFENSENPHGMGYQRLRAYFLGVNLAKHSAWEVVNDKTKIKLHEKFKDIYLKTDYLRNLELYPEVKYLFEMP